MRQKRAKAYRKLMELYSMSFGFRQPYQVLVDSAMCKAAVDSKTDLVKQLSAVLSGFVKPMITQCCIHELYIQGHLQQPAVDLAKTFERRKCNHKEAIAGDECLASVVGETNKHRYVIATQSQPLRAQLRQIPGIPIVHVNRSVMILEPPSDATLKAKATNEEKSLNPSEPDKAILSAIAAPESTAKKRKRPKGPNPLSVKKKKVKANNSTSSPPNVKGITWNDKRSPEQMDASTKRVDDAQEKSGKGDGEDTAAVLDRRRRKRRKTSKPFLDTDI